MTLIIIWLKNWAFLRLVQKTCWSILKSFYNGEKIPLISPPLHEEKLISNFQVDANLFNTFFASQCTPHPNSSTLPEVQTHFNNARINSTTSTKENIKILPSLDINKAHGTDEIPVRMIKICDRALDKPLSIIFKNCIKCGKFPDTWKNQIFAYSIRRKNFDTQLCSTFQRITNLYLIINKIFGQMILVLTFIYWSLANPSLESHGVFLDMPKAFDNVWHDELSYKLRSIGVSEPEDFCQWRSVRLMSTER